MPNQRSQLILVNMKKKRSICMKFYALICETIKINIWGEPMKRKETLENIDEQTAQNIVCYRTAL